MKKFLQKSLKRVHALLLLAVMFTVGGNSAYAEEWQQVFYYDFSTDWDDRFTIIDANGDGTKINCYGGQLYYSWNSYNKANDYAVMPAENLEIGTYRVRIKYSATSDWTEKFEIVLGTKAEASSLTTVILPEVTDVMSSSTKEAVNTFEIETSGTYYVAVHVTSEKDMYRLNLDDFYLEYDLESAGSPKNYTDFTYSSQNAGNQGLFLVSSDVITFNAPVTIHKMPVFQGAEVTSATTDGNNVNVVFPEVNVPGTYTLTFPKGALQIGDDYNNEFSVTYTLVQDPNKLYTTFTFSGAGLPYTRDGVNYTMPSGYDFQIGDTFVSDGVTFTFTNCPSGWFNNAQRFTLGQRTAFTISAPEGYELTKLVFSTDNGQVYLAWMNGLTYGGYMTQTWTGNAESLDFSASYDMKIQTIDVTCVKVNIDPIEYTVNFVDAPDGAEVILDGQTLSASNNTYTIDKKLRESSLVVNNPEGYWTEVEFDGEHTYTVTYHHWYFYTAQVNHPMGAIRYNGNYYGNGDQFQAKNLIREDELSAYPLERNDASVSVAETADYTYTVTVTYTEYPTLAVSASSTDAEGNYWTTFCYNKPVSFPEGVTPCIVTGSADDGTLTVEPFEAQKNEYTYDLDFTTGAYSGNSFTAMDGNLNVRGVNWIFNTGYGYAETAYTEDWTTITFTLADDFNGVIKSIRFLTATDGNSAWFNYEGGYMNLWSEIPVNGKTMTIGAWYDQMIKHFYLDIEEAETLVIPAGAGILVKSEEPMDNVLYTVHPANAETVDTTGNLLVGCTESATWNEAGKTYYKFSLDADDAAGSAGFYWGVEGGASIQAHAGKAYLVLDTPAASNSRYLISGNGLTTGIDAIATEAAENIFNLQGQRVVAPKAGVYVKNGKKIIVK